MARPAAKELTERELEIMHLFWAVDQLTAVEARERLAEQGTDLAYVTVANLIRLLVEKGFLDQVTQERPFLFRAVRTFADVSQSLVGDLMRRVFHGSREQLLVNLLGQGNLSRRERKLLQEFLEEESQ